MQSYPEALAGQVMVNDVLDMGLVGDTIGVPRSQSIQETEPILKAIV